MRPIVFLFFAVTAAGALAQNETPPATDAAAPAPSDAAPAATPEGPVPTPPGGSTADEAFDLRVKGLQEQVNDLKEKIFRTKARLLLLQETVLGGDITSGAKAVLLHRNEMGASFVLEQVAYALDGAPIYTKVDVEGDLDRREEFEIFNGRIVPGNHQISVRMTYRGHGYGLFSYLEGYKFKVQSSYTFNAEGGKVTQVKVVGYEKGGITTDLKDRPAVRYDVEVTRDAALKKKEAATAEGAAPEAPSGEGLK